VWQHSTAAPINTGSCNTTALPCTGVVQLRVSPAVEMRPAKWQRQCKPDR
jgi:hypothetical protein